MTKPTKVYDSGDVKQVKAAKKVARILDNRMMNGMAKIMADSESRYVLASFLETAGVFRSVFHRDPTQHAFNEGQRNSGLWWVQQGLLHSPNFMSTLQSDEDSPLKAGTDDYSTGSTSSDDDTDGIDGIDQ